MLNRATIERRDGHTQALSNGVHELARMGRFIGAFNGAFPIGSMRKERLSAVHQGRDTMDIGSRAADRRHRQSHLPKLYRNRPARPGIPGDGTEPRQRGPCHL